MSADEFADLVCPLPVLRHAWPDDDGPGPIAVHHCGEPLFVNHTNGRYLLAGGETESCGPTWEVVCGGGHTLLVPDHEGSDDFADIPFDPALAQEALAGLGVLVQGVGVMNFKPLPPTKPGGK